MILLTADTPGLGLQNTIILIWWVMIVVIILVGIYLVLKRNSGKRDKKYSCPNCGMHSKLKDFVFCSCHSFNLSLRYSPVGITHFSQNDSNTNYNENMHSHINNAIMTTDCTYT